MLPETRVPAEDLHCRQYVSVFIRFHAIIFRSLTVSTSYDNAKITATAHQRVNLIVRAFVSRDIVTLLRAYTTYVRPILEFNTVVWSPSLKCGITRVEKVFFWYSAVPEKQQVNDSRHLAGGSRR